MKPSYLGACIFSFNNFHEEVSQGACGLTFDWQKLSDGKEICQWLWGRPVTHDLAQLPEAQLLEVAKRIPEAAYKNNLVPVDPISVGLNLPNEIAVLEQCPFRPGECNGQHIVASGAGLITG